ncbi:10064_t:CDS:2 [Rhizophagus irregularis]|nr:10064_t:CDS:2 [Rhizophagus irregularis]
MRRFTNEMIFKIATGTKNDAIASYYKILINSNSLNEKENEKSDESKKLIESLETHLAGIFHFFAFDNFSRNYIPYIRGKTKKLLKNRDYLSDKDPTGLPRVLKDYLRKFRLLNIIFVNMGIMWCYELNTATD